MVEWEIRQTFFFLIADLRAEKREEAYKKLAGSRDKNVSDLAEIGKTIANVLFENADPKTLDSVIEFFDHTPTESDYWYKLMETSGQVVLGEALSIAESKRKEELLRYGLKLIGRALSGWVPVSETTIEMLKRIKTDDKEIKDFVAFLIKRNEELSPNTSLFAWRAPITTNHSSQSSRRKVIG
jgi:hypothetical protein